MEAVSSRRGGAPAKRTNKRHTAEGSAGDRPSPASTDADAAASEEEDDGEEKNHNRDAEGEFDEEFAKGGQGAEGHAEAAFGPGDELEHAVLSVLDFAEGWDRIAEELNESIAGV